MLRVTRRFISAHKIRGSIATQVSFSSSESGSSQATKASKDRVSTDDIIHLVAEAHHLSLAETRRILTTTFDAIIDAVAEKKQVSISKFGTFVPSRSKEYTARNPKTGEPVHVPAKDKVKFRAFDAFKKTVSR
ncbi:hypothetical protein FisN_5Lh147 [Fistulifera solaris]|uniref:DNA-binding protein HU-beta n=1 Tax=Fistulifera solaris TaxID=1519565 RepID=A0A1Z5JJ34_FISSO|nr:hypothetical protein FisN_5Lh147 [Fistulifera solaris]|eukprot:GAX13946.1 hypothetical protein FisN_5Lh147 [Fistulifera solaris]